MPGRPSLGIRVFLLAGSKEDTWPAIEKPDKRIFIAVLHLLVVWRVRNRVLDEAKDWTPSTAVQFLFEADDLTTGVTPKTKRQKAALEKMNLKELSEDL